MTADEYKAALDNLELAWISVPPPSGAVAAERLDVEFGVHANVITPATGSPYWEVFINGVTHYGNPHDSVEACKHASLAKSLQLLMARAEEAQKALLRD